MYTDTLQETDERDTFKGLYPTVSAANFNARILNENEAIRALESKIRQYPNRVSDLKYATIEYKVDKKRIQIVLKFQGSKRNYVLIPKSINIPAGDYRMLDDANDNAEQYLLSKERKTKDGTKRRVPPKRKQKRAITITHHDNGSALEIDRNTLISVREIVARTRSRLEKELAR